MKKLLIPFISILMASCCNEDCQTHSFPSYNGFFGVQDLKHSADVGIDPLTFVDSTETTLILNGKISCFYEGGNNDARNVKATVILPLDVNVLNVTVSEGVTYCYKGGKEKEASDSLNTGILEFYMPHLWRNAADELEKTGYKPFVFRIETSKSKKPKALNQEGFAIFVNAQSPDITLCNNYWYWQRIKKECKKISQDSCTDADLELVDLVWDETSKILKSTIKNRGSSVGQNFLVYHEALSENAVNNPICQISHTVSSLQPGETIILNSNFSSENCQRNSLNNAIRFGGIVDSKSNVQECIEANNEKSIPR